MSDYWISHFNASVENFPDSPLKQVGKTVNGREVDEQQVSYWCQSVREHLNIQPDDNVVDLCCGNGVLTRQVAEHCRSITGVDFAASLIKIAEEKFPAENIRYAVGDVSVLGADFFAGIQKVYMYEAWQHLSLASVEALLADLAQSPSVSRFFIAGIPDTEKFDRFYDTEAKRAFQREREQAGKPHIGKWWSKQELCEVITRKGLQAEIIVQPPHLYCSHFRFDCLVSRQLA